MTYEEIKNQQPELVDCFFAFSDEQFAEGIKEKNLEGKKIFRAGHGLFGTDEGIKNLMAFYGNLNERIAKECDPQKVYDYEFINHECDYVCDDTEAIEITFNLFGLERTKTVKRRYVYATLEEIAEKAEQDK